MFLSGCFFRPSLPTPEEQSEKTGEFVADGGYSTALRYKIASINESWRHDGQSVDISLLAPTEPGVYPLIIYLPGLGEQAGDGGRVWRETWAKAGYAVFSLQARDVAEALKELKAMSGPEGLDENGPLLFADEGDREQDEDNDGKPRRPSRAARNSELHYLGREYFSQAGLQMRVEHLLWSYQQLKARVRTGQTLFARIDLSRVILAGYDIGAQTAAAAIGEVYPINQPQNLDFKPRAAMIFSPYIDSAVGSSRARYNKIDMPMLAVTGTEDNDPYGLGFAQGRAAIWEYAQPGSKYLLELKYAVHQLLSGGDAMHRHRQAGPESGGLGFGGSRGGMPGFRGDYQGAGSMGMPPGGRVQDEDQDFKQIAAILSTSVAFLDSTVRADSFAHAWLTGEKAKWLDKTAVLKSR